MINPVSLLWYISMIALSDIFIIQAAAYDLQCKIYGSWMSRVDSKIIASHNIKLNGNRLESPRIVSTATRTTLQQLKGFQWVDCEISPT